MIDKTNIEYVKIQVDSVCLYAKNDLMKTLLSNRFGKPENYAKFSGVRDNAWIVTLDQAKALWYDADQEQKELALRVPRPPL
jgi:hypothetical protein